MGGGGGGGGGGGSLAGQTFAARAERERNSGHLGRFLWTSPCRMLVAPIRLESVQ